MKKWATIVVLGCAVTSAPTAAAQWQDAFDTYSNGFLAAQSDWEQWDGSTGVDANVVDTFFSTPGKGLLVSGQPSFGINGNDVVYDFANMAGGQPTTGQWIVSTRVYVPSSRNSGIGHFIMLNRYPVQKNWSLQVSFDVDNSVVDAVEPAGLALPLITDEWVNLTACIDLDTDRVDIFYGDDLLIENGDWIGNGVAQIACIDLYGDEPGSGGIEEMYYDNFQMEKAGGPGMDLVISPNPVADGGSIDLDIEAPQAKGGRAVLFTWHVNDFPFVSRLLTVPLDNNGEFNLPTTLPPGLSGVQIGVKAFALPPGGGTLNESKSERLVIQ